MPTLLGVKKFAKKNSAPIITAAVGVVEAVISLLVALNVGWFKDLTKEQIGAIISAVVAIGTLIQTITVATTTVSKDDPN